MNYGTMLELSLFTPLLCVGISIVIAYTREIGRLGLVAFVPGAVLVGIWLPMSLGYWWQGAMGDTIAAWLVKIDTGLTILTWCSIVLLRPKKWDIVILLLVTIGCLSSWFYIFLWRNCPT